MNLKIIIRDLLLILLLYLGLLNGTNQIDTIIGFILFIYVSSVLFLGLRINLMKRWLILPLLLMFVLTSQLNSSKIKDYLSREPINKSYRTDMDDFLKTFYRMKQGGDYYSSYKYSIEQNPFKGLVSTNLWSWRLPTLFLIWTWFTGKTGLFIYYLFLLNCIGVLFCSYKLIEKLLHPKVQHFAILAPYLLFPYLHFANRDTTLLQSEWWGMFFYIYGVCFLIIKKRKISLLCFVLAILSRELFISPLALSLMYSLFSDRKNIFTFCVPIFIYVIALIFHAHFVSITVGFNSNFLTPRIHEYNKSILLATLAFGSWEYAFYRLRVLAILSFFGTLAGFVNIRKAFVLFSYSFFMLEILLIGTSVYNDYWGAVYVPFLLITVPLLMNLFV